MNDAISRSAVLDIISEERRFAESLREIIEDNEDRAHNTGELACAIGLARKIKELPAVDAVPVVRCKECKHRGGYNCPMYHTETSFDDLDGFDDYNVDKTDGDGFCHRGERRE